MRNRDRRLELTMTIISLWTHLLLCQQGKVAVPRRIVFSSRAEEENIYAFAQLNHEGIRALLTDANKQLYGGGRQRKVARLSRVECTSDEFHVMLRCTVFFCVCVCHRCGSLHVCYLTLLMSMCTRIDVAESSASSSSPIE